MSDRNPRDSPPLPSSSSSRRRSSFVDMFSKPSQSTTTTTPTQPRRLSITTLGLSTIPSATHSPFNTMRARAESMSSANSGSFDESPFDDDEERSNATHGTSASPSLPSTPWGGRRMSFGGKGSARNGSIGSNGGGGTSPGLNGTLNLSVGGAGSRKSTSFAALPEEDGDILGGRSASAKTSVPNSREGFDYATTLRTRAERVSIGNAAMAMAAAQSMANKHNNQKMHQRSKSVSVEPPKANVQPKRQAPDAFQERILKGDFYMD